MTTLGTRLHTLLKGRLVGKDSDGRSYYESRKLNRLGGGERRRERWVIYKKGDDPSAVPPVPVSKRHPWQIPYHSNLTGTAKAYHPQGSDYAGGQRAKATGDYESWVPEV